MEVHSVGLEEWGAVLPDEGFEVFHTPAALSVLDEHTDGRMELLVGYKGDHAVAVCPAFVVDRAVGRLVTSPPPSMGVPGLGPLVTPNSPKRRKVERANRRFAAGIREELALDERTTLFRIACSPSYGDPRPYIWAEDAVDVSFTYRLDLADRTAEAALADASKSFRRSVRDGRALDRPVVVGDLDDTRAVFEQTRARYEEQDRGFTLEWPYVRDLVTALDERARTYVLRDEDGTVVSGVVVLYSNDYALYWLGGTRAEYDGTSVNAAIHWRIVEDVADDPPVASVSGYDLMGADTERLAKYKSKFGADLVAAYEMESGGAPTAVAKRLYEAVAR